MNGGKFIIIMIMASALCWMLVLAVERGNLNIHIKSSALNAEPSLSPSIDSSNSNTKLKDLAVFGEGFFKEVGKDIYENGKINNLIPLISGVFILVIVGILALIVLDFTK